jgi:hypothetical protein
MNKEKEVKYYKAQCGCAFQECDNSWKWIYDCHAGWNEYPSASREYPFSNKKVLITKGEVAILKLLGKAK